MGKVVGPVIGGVVGVAVGIATGNPFLGLEAGGAAMGVAGGVQAGKAASAAGEANARADLEMGAIQERLQRESDQRVISSAMSRIGATGVGYSGSPLDVQRASAAAAEQNALAIRREAELKAEADRRAGSDASYQAYIGAAGTGVKALADFGPGIVARLRRPTFQRGYVPEVSPRATDYGPVKLG